MPPTYRKLTITSTAELCNGWSVLNIHDGAIHIGEARALGSANGWTVRMFDGESPEAYGLDSRAHRFDTVECVEIWACDARLRATMNHARELTTRDLQRLRGHLADMVTERTADAMEAGR